MKKILTLVVLGVFAQSTLIAQEESSSFRLELSTQAINTLNINIEEGRRVNIFYEPSQDIFNYAIHLFGFWDVNKRLELGVGLGFSNRDSYYNYIDDYCFTPIGCKYPGIGGYTRRRAIEVPVELRFNWFKENKRVDPFVSFGLNNGIPILYFQEKGVDRSKLDLTHYTLGLSLGLGTRVQLSEKWSLVTSATIARNNSYSLDTTELLQADPNVLSDLYEWSGKFGVRRSF